MVTPPENPIIAPRLHEIFECLRQRNQSRLSLQNHSASKYRPNTGAAGEAIASIIREIAAHERSMLSGLISLTENVEQATRSAGSSPTPVDLIQRFRPFEVAKLILDPGGRNFDHLYAIISRQSDSEISDPIEDVVATVTIDDRRWRTFDVALDLLQYWELLLRNQTDLECSDFSSATRKTLLGRVTGTVFHDGIFHQLGGPSSPLPQPANHKAISAVEWDVSRRLDGITLHLAEIDARRNKMSDFSAKDLELNTASNRKLKEAERLYHDELSHVLSELVHLYDNVKKWLKSHQQSPDALSIVENLRPYRVAACYVNTLKHGIRGRNKATAVADTTAVFLAGHAESPTQDDKILDAPLAINYEGDEYQATELIDDVVQLWELFLRNHTSIDTKSFRVDIGKRLLERQHLSTYSAELPDGIKDHLRQMADERLKLNI